jgi:hypothetical protein
MWCLLDHSKVTFNFFREYGLQRSTVHSTFLSFMFISTYISFPFSVVQWNFYREIYSNGGLGYHMSHVPDFFWLSHSYLYHVGTQSLLHIVIPILEKKCLAACRKVWVMLTAKLNVLLEVTNHKILWCRMTKPRSLPIAGFHLKKHFDCFFMYFIRT